jgi:REP element-mobilizing transposase RayT
MTADPVALSRGQAGVLRAAFESTAAFRGWTLLAGAVMHNHVHLVVGVVGDPEPSDVLRDFKRRGSLALNRRNGGDPRRWWTRGGSTRRLHRDENVLAAARYVRNQWRPLVVWVHPSVQ